MDAKMDHVLIPCGHVICENDSKHFVGKNCPFCRKKVQQAVKMFM